MVAPMAAQSSIDEPAATSDRALTVQDQGLAVGRGIQYRCSVTVYRPPSVVDGFEVVVRKAAEVSGEVQGHRGRIVVIDGDRHGGAAQDVQRVNAMSEEFFRHALAAVVRMREKLRDDCFTVVFGDDDGGRNSTVRSRRYERRSMDSMARAFFHGYADPAKVATALPRGTAGVGLPMQTGKHRKIVGSQRPDGGAGRRHALVSGHSNQFDQKRSRVPSPVRARHP
jgi:hypothetical protein